MPGPGECVGYRIPLHAGGADRPENLELARFDEAWGRAARVRSDALSGVGTANRSAISSREPERIADPSTDAAARSTSGADLADGDPPAGELGERRHAVVGETARHDARRTTRGPCRSSPRSRAASRGPASGARRSRTPCGRRPRRRSARPAGARARRPGRRAARSTISSIRRRCAAASGRAPRSSDRVAHQLPGPWNVNEPPRSMRWTSAPRRSISSGGQTSSSGLARRPGGEHRRVLQQDQRVGDLAGQPALGEPVHRLVRRSVGDRLGRAQEPRLARHAARPRGLRRSPRSPGSASPVPGTGRRARRRSRGGPTTSTGTRGAGSRWRRR